jgi:glyoxylate/hydroxypyruvate reductase
MRIVLQTAAANAEEWHSALLAALPEAEIALWPHCLARVDYALVWRPPAELFARLPRPKAFFNLGAGVDALLALPGLPGDIPVIRLEDAGMAAQMVEYVMLAVLAAYREWPIYAEAQRNSCWQPRPHVAKSDFGIGLLGLGVLGQAIAGALAPLGFPLAGWSRTPKSIAGVRTFAGNAELASFLAASRVLVCLLPATADTRDLLDRTRLSQLPEGASFVNVARGDIVVESDLIALLDAGHLRHATLDVFRTEPLPTAHPFWRHARVTVTPHVSAATLVADSVGQIAAKIRRLEEGLPVTGAIDRGRGY